jgi:chorismate mutase/prephenate dehydratase
MEKNGTVVYLGPPATHTHLACIQYFGSSFRTIPKESIQEIFEAVEKNEVNFGVVPIENSTEGAVNRTLDMFIESEVKIYGEILIRISHDLLSRTGSTEEIQRIYSHPQALEQCRKWLKKNFPQALCVETVSTAKAAQIAIKDQNIAAIASAFAAHLYGLNVVAPQIEDYPHNYTRFLVLSHQSPERIGIDKTSILFSISHAPGSLYRVLKPFSEKGINLTKIESRPIKNKPWEYLFFLDFEGHMMDPSIQDAMAEAKENLLFFKDLGSYPRSS